MTKYVYVKLPNRETFINIKKRLPTHNKNKRFRIIIDNCRSDETDKKSFSISCVDDLDEVFSGFQVLFSKIIKEVMDGMIVFEDIKAISTHRVLIQECCEKPKSRGFSIEFANYSSTEIIELLIKKIRGRK